MKCHQCVYPFFPLSLDFETKKFCSIGPHTHTGAATFRNNIFFPWISLRFIYIYTKYFFIILMPSSVPFFEMCMCVRVRHCGYVCCVCMLDVIFICWMWKNALSKWLINCKCEKGKNGFVQCVCAQAAATLSLSFSFTHTHTVTTVVTEMIS